MKELDRREFLEIGIMASAGLVISLHCPLSKFALAESTVSSFAPNAWLQIFPTGEVNFFLDKAEMGQGVYTTLSMIISEELGIDPTALVIKSAAADRIYVNPTSGIQITGGSTSVATSYNNLRKAGAVARHLLAVAASEHWKIPLGQCEAKSGKIFKIGTSDSLGFGELAIAASALKAPESVPLKSPEKFEVIGREFIGRLDNHLKVTGKATFGIDVQIPGMLVAVVIRPPKLGSKVKSFNASTAKLVPGIKQVIQMPMGIAVVAEKYWQAKKAREMVEIEWQSDSKLSMLNSTQIWERFEKRSSDSGKKLFSKGEIEKGLLGASKKIEAVYKIPYVAHAAMEPCNFTADVKKDSCHLYGPTQSAGIAQQVASEITGLPYEKVFVETSFLGGGFGRRLQQDFVAEAVTLSMMIEQPVKIIWSREDDMQNSMYRPSNLHFMQGGLRSTGELEAWSHKMVGPSILTQVASDYARTSFPVWLPGWAKKIGGWAGSKSFGLLSNDPTAMEGASDLVYAVPHVGVHFVQDDPGVPLGFWRSVGHSYTAFVVESFIDELAHAARKDPYLFRRNYLSGEGASRNKGVLELVATKAHWTAPAKPKVGRGIAQHHSFGSWVAYVVDVSLNSENEIKIERVVAAVDCGLVVNPDGARAQIESAVNFALSAILKSEITLNEGTVEQTNFDTYEVLRFNEAPKEIEIHFVKNNHPPSGLGEPGVPPLAAAVANAVFALTGKRLRKLPLKFI